MLKTGLLRANLLLFMLGTGRSFRWECGEKDPKNADYRGFFPGVSCWIDQQTIGDSCALAHSEYQAYDKNPLLP